MWYRVIKRLSDIYLHMLALALEKNIAKWFRSNQQIAGKQDVYGRDYSIPSIPEFSNVEIAYLISIFFTCNRVRDLDKLNQGEYSKYQLYRVIKRLPDTLSDLVKLNHLKFNKCNLLFIHVPCQIFIIITGTCCTRLSWVCRGRWGCPRASW